MNIVFISHNLKDPEAWRLALNLDKIIHIAQPDKFLGMRDASIALDELIYIDRQPVDFVLYCNNESGVVKCHEFQNEAPHIEHLSDTLYFTQTKSWDHKQIIDLAGNFYCRPHAFTIMGSLHKINIPDTLLEESKSNEVDTRIIYGLTKAGYDISLL